MFVCVCVCGCVGECIRSTVFLFAAFSLPQTHEDIETEKKKHSHAHGLIKESNGLSKKTLLWGIKHLARHWQLGVRNSEIQRWFC